MSESSADNEPLYTRTGHTIRDETTRERKVFKSNNQAKKKSRRLQMEADGALGRGTVRVAE